MIFDEFYVEFTQKQIISFRFRLWDIECGACLRVLEGHEELVRCIRFDSKRIVSGAYDGKIKVWDLVAALDPRAPSTALCLKTLEVNDSFMCLDLLIHISTSKINHISISNPHFNTKKFGFFVSFISE